MQGCNGLSTSICKTGFSVLCFIVSANKALMLKN